MFHLLFGPVSSGKHIIHSPSRTEIDSVHLAQHRLNNFGDRTVLDRPEHRLMARIYFLRATGEYAWRKIQLLHALSRTPALAWLRGTEPPSAPGSRSFRSSQPTHFPALGASARCSCFWSLNFSLARRQNSSMSSPVVACSSGATWKCSESCSCLTRKFRALATYFQACRQFWPRSCPGIAVGQAPSSVSPETNLPSSDRLQCAHSNTWHTPRNQRTKEPATQTPHSAAAKTNANTEATVAHKTQRNALNFPLLTRSLTDKNGSTSSLSPFLPNCHVQTKDPPDVVVGSYR